MDKLKRRILQGRSGRDKGSEGLGHDSFSSINDMGLHASECAGLLGFTEGECSHLPGWSPSACVVAVLGLHAHSSRHRSLKPPAAFVPRPQAHVKWTRSTCRRPT